MLRNLALSLAVLLLAGCAVTPRHAEYPPYEGTGFTDRAWTQRERLLAKSDFSVELVRFTDDRNPRTEGKDPGDNRVYQYDPDQLLQGVNARVPVLINKYLAYRPRMPQHYRVEVELTRLKTEILNGSLLDGQFGRYSVDLEARVVVRRADSTVAINRPYSLQVEQRRTTFNGRSPSKEMDRSRMYDLAEDTIRQLSESVGWDIRRIDSHVWDVFKDAPKNTLPAPVMTTPTLPSPSAPAASDIQG